MSTTPEEPQSSAHWLEIVRQKVAGIRFGSVQITVHDGRVTQVEAVEKTRIQADRAEAEAVPPALRKKLGA